MHHCLSITKVAKLAGLFSSYYTFMTHSPLSPPAKGKIGDKTTWGNLQGSSSACALAYSALNNLDSTLVVTPNMGVAERLQHDVIQYMGGTTNTLPVFIFPDWETLPYDTFSPHQDIISNRMRCLYQLAKGTRTLVIVSAQTLAQRLVPQSYVLSKSLVLNKGENLQREFFRQKLIFAGYNLVETVYQHGEFALRGALIDVYPMGSDSAYRIELFDDEIESLREFDPETQRTVTQVERIELLPGKECPIDQEAISLFRNNWHTRFDVNHRACPVYQDLVSGLSPAGVEYFLPLFFESTSTLFDYLPPASQVFMLEGVEPAYEEFWREASNRYESRCGDIERPIMPPSEIFLPINEAFSALKTFPRVSLQVNAAPEKAGHYNFDVSPPPLVLMDSRATNPLLHLEQLICSTEKRILFCAESSGRREILKEHLHKIGVAPDDCANVTAFVNSDCSIAITVAALEQGISCNSPKLLIISEPQIFGTLVRQARRRKTSGDDNDKIFKNLTELNIGAPVVHIDHGVGRYKGLQTIEHDGHAEEFLVLDYANSAKLYVPVANLHLISRYSGLEESHAPLHSLGSEKWQKAKRKAAEQVRDVAAELLLIYAKRQAKEGFSYRHPKEDYDIFCAG
ncbi:MAG: transcription-repair coupling factor (superfamily II helicase), partial [Lentisphaeria bacterium]